MGAIEPAPLHPDLERALAAFAPAPAARARRALSLLLEQRSARGDCWSSSRLTGDGFPVELGFATGDDRLRYTVEPCAAEVALPLRLGWAWRAIEELSGERLDPAPLRRLTDAQRGAELAYGAWIGARHGDGSDQFKIYAELGPGGERAALPGFAVPGLADRMLTTRMLAYVPAAHSYELYLRLERARLYHLPRLLAPCQLQGQAEMLGALLERAYGHALRDALPGPSVGVSYVVAASGEVRSFTLYLFARSLWGSDARIRERFGRALEEGASAAGVYRTVTSALAARERWTTCHGMLGIRLDAQGASWSVGLRPE